MTVHRWRRLLGAVLAVATPLGMAQVVAATPAPAAALRTDLRVLVVDDGNPWVQGMAVNLATEGVPFTTVTLSDGDRPRLTAGFLSAGDEGFYQAVVLPSVAGSSGLGADEVSALTAYEAQFGVRQVDMFVYPNNTVGLTTPVWAGDLTGMSATVTAAGRADGFGYLTGSVPFLAGSYGYLPTPLTASSTPALPAGAAVTPVLTATIPGTSTQGSLLTSYRSPSGVEELVVGAAFNANLQQFRMLAHGILSWATRGVHFGYNRNYLTFHFDDALAYDARWSTTNHCTPGEDCPTGTPATPDIRMTATDVNYVVNWQQAQGYTITLPFNGYYSEYDNEGTPWNGTDTLTNAFVANRSAFRWLNHGYQHVYQGCQQDFTVVPWRCQTSPAGQPPAADGSNLLWVPQADVSNEISVNAARGTALGLSFDAAEYLSGEHSGLYLTPQQPVDNPGFAAALSQNGVKYIGADASREPAARVVGGATTVPRHPVAVYFNVATQAEEVSEYNWFYTSQANGGSGYCEANPATATCLAAPLDPNTGFTSYIVPNDTANDLRFILSNDPRPFYAHVSNLTGPDYLALTLMGSILTTYRAAYSTQTPLVNLTLTQAADVLNRQQAWAQAGVRPGAAVSGYLQDGQVTITNPTSTPAPVTVPEGTTVNGAAFGEAYGGERSGYLTGDGTLNVPVLQAPAFTSPAALTTAPQRAFSFTVAASGSPAPMIALSGALPAGVRFTGNTNGTATLSGTPTTPGSYPLTLTASNRAGSAAQALTLVIGRAPAITSTPTGTATTGRSFSKAIKSSGSPTPTLTLAGALPAGLTFLVNPNGTATLSGTPSAGTGGSYPLTVTATNVAGTATQALTLTVRQTPTITSPPTADATRDQPFTFTVTATGYPTPKLSRLGILPPGVTWRDNGNGTATLAGTPTTRGSWLLLVTASNTAGIAAPRLTIRVQ